ncbi:13875_t:CDS:2, partial [Entrophospora sp. SA101]
RQHNKENKEAAAIPANPLAGIKDHLTKYGIITLFDREYPYTKKLYDTLGNERMNLYRQQWNETEDRINEAIQLTSNKRETVILINKYHQVASNYLDNNYTSLEPLLSEIYEKPFRNYVHKSVYELTWYQHIYITFISQFIRKRGSLTDSSSSELKYSEEIINPLFSAIFQDTEDKFWMETGELENLTIKIQKNSRKEENERLKIGDKHDRILYMNLHGESAQVGFVEVAGNAFDKDLANRNHDLTKLLKAMSLSIWSQHEHIHFNNLKLMSFAVLVHGKYEIRVRNYYDMLTHYPRKVTRSPNSTPPDSSPK